MNIPDTVVATLDAGGTNLVFSLVENGNINNETVNLPTASENITGFLKKIIHGFETLQNKSTKKISAISFSFPGPADYEEGIIGDLENLPFFRGGVPLKKILENKFKIPVFINNDGDLFALGEAMHGFLPEINLHAPKVYKNLLGVTLGTGFGGGIVSNGELFTGDNSAAAEINRMSSYQNREQSVEEVLSIRGIRYLFAKEANTGFEQTPQPYDIFRIGKGEIEGNKEAAKNAWKQFGEELGNALANAVTLTDSCVVIGGGLSGAYPLFLQTAVNKMNGLFKRKDGGNVQRMEIFAYNYENDDCRNDFLKDEKTIIEVPFSEESVPFRKNKKIAVGISRLNTSNAVALGAYSFAKKMLY
jgi:glucokinase